jgi:hypothetical protein
MAQMRMFSDADARGFEPFGSVQKSVLLHETRKTPTGKTVFLSHSSKDDNLVPGVIVLLQRHGATVYADDYDTRLPDPPNPATAAVLRGEIQGCPRLVVLVTNNSASSRWIPWELGLGDGFHNIPPNAILASTPSGVLPAWLGTQYFHLYPKVVNVAGAWWVTDPAGLAHWPLRQWLTTPVSGGTP